MDHEKPLAKSPSPSGRAGAGLAAAAAREQPGVLGAPLVGPTQEIYAELQKAFDWFNVRLFDGVLPPCLITLQREKSSVGYFSAARFGSVRGERTDEIALNPSYLGIVPLVETLATLAHEMCHQHQHHFGTPGRGRYHNEEWGARMQQIGLMPSRTGKPGGRRTGDIMADYPIEGGLFLQACRDLVAESFTFSWYDRRPQPVQIAAGRLNHSMSLGPEFGGGQALASAAGVAQNIQGFDQPEPTPTEDGSAPAIAAPPAAAAGTRAKYRCSCAKPTQLWAKQGLKSLFCSECQSFFVETSGETRPLGPRGLRGTYSAALQ